jgi:hypothetical protein
MSDLQAIVERLLETVAGARGLPLSASCVLNRLELLGILGQLREAAAAELTAAEAVTSRREAILRDAEREADRIVEDARRERLARTSDSEVVREADLRARRLLAAAHDASSTARSEADSYVDGRLADLEVILARTLTSVTRGRAALAGETGPGPVMVGLAAAVGPPGAGGPVSLPGARGPVDPPGAANPLGAGGLVGLHAPLTPATAPVPLPPDELGAGVGAGVGAGAGEIRPRAGVGEATSFPIALAPPDAVSVG